MKISSLTLFSLLPFIGLMVKASPEALVYNYDFETSIHSGPSALTNMERISIAQMCLTQSFNKAQKYFDGNWEMEDALYVSEKNASKLRFNFHASSGLGGNAECPTCCDPCNVNFHAAVSTECPTCCDPCLPSFIKTDDEITLQTPGYNKEMTSMTASDLESLATHRAWEEYFCACLEENNLGSTKCGIKINGEGL